MIARDVEDNADVAVALDDLASADGYTLQHSIDVAAIGMLVGPASCSARAAGSTTSGERTSSAATAGSLALGLGLLLHDIGKLIIPIDVLNKPGKLDEAEWELMRAHPRAGVEMLRSDLISPLVKVVVRSHHERWDGGGYPDGLPATASTSSRASPPVPTSTTPSPPSASTRPRGRRTWACRSCSTARAARSTPTSSTCSAAWSRRTRPAPRCGCPTAAAAWWPRCRPRASTGRVVRIGWDAERGAGHALRGRHGLAAG